MIDKVSVIVPVYNVQEYLRQCVDSIVDQTYKNLQIILVDDGSTDESGAICDAYVAADDRVVVLHKENGGLSSARNAGMDIADGSYITFVDSDDWLAEGFIYDMIEVLNGYQCELAIASARGQEMDPLGVTLYSSRDAVRELMTDRDIKNYAWGKVYSRHLLDGLRYPEGRKYEDIPVTWQTFLRTEEPIALVLRNGYHYRVREGSISRSGSLEHAFHRICSYQDRYDELVQVMPELERIMMEQILYAVYLYWQLRKKADSVPDHQKFIQWFIQRRDILMTYPRSKQSRRQIDMICNGNQNFRKYEFLHMMKKVKGTYGK